MYANDSLLDFFANPSSKCKTKIVTPTHSLILLFPWPKDVCVPLIHLQSEQKERNKSTIVPFPHAAFPETM